MRILLIVLAFLLALQISQKASASILVEPYLGYTMAEFDNGSSEYDANGTVYGFRLGYELPGLWFALDFMGTMQKVEFGGASQDADAKRIGVVVGATVPMGIRFWGGYYIKDELEFDGGTKYDGSGLKVGIGFRLIPLLHLNFEYLMSSYDEANGSSLSSEDELNGIVATLSVPLSF